MSKSTGGTWKRNMAGQLRVLIDLNIILDTLQRREPHYADSAQALALAESGRISGLVAAHSWTTLFYLYAKEQSAEQARVHLTELLQFLAVAPVDQAVIEQALSLPYRDFEDAVQMMAGLRAGAEYLLTRDAGGYRAGPLPVLRPAELLALLR
jgi:predicted nucleic acid-binding protein